MDFSTGLFDMVGVFIGFICIILLLSIVVTAMVQAVQAVLKLRARNLIAGITSLVQNNYGKSAADSNAIAIKALNASNIRFIGRHAITEGRKKIPPVTYIAPEELPTALEEAGLEDAVQRSADLQKEFYSMWNQLEDRFLSIMRVVTLICSIVVAGYFQVSTPDLLATLSTDPDLRKQLEAYVQGAGEPQAFGNFEDMAGKVVTRLKAEFPDVQAPIQLAAAGVLNRGDLVARMDALLAGMGEDQRSRITARCISLLGEMSTAQRGAARNQVKALLSDLPRIGIHGWHGKWAFYYDGGPNVANIIGVLVTAVLLSMGAPFWFERLKEAVKFRDILSKGIKSENGGNNGDGGQQAVG